MSKTAHPTAEPEVGQVYEDDRGDEQYQIIYVDGQVVLLRSEREGGKEDHAHRMESRVQFDTQLSAGRMEHKSESDLDLISLKGADWSEVGYIGESTAENLQDEGYQTIVDIRQADDSELLMVDGLGVKGLENLRNFVR